MKITKIQSFHTKTDGHQKPTIRKLQAIREGYMIMTFKSALKLDKTDQ